MYQGQNRIHFKNENKLPHGWLFFSSVQIHNLKFYLIEMRKCQPPHPHAQKPFCSHFLVWSTILLSPALKELAGHLSNNPTEALHQSVENIPFQKKSVPKPRDFKISISNSQYIVINIY